MAQDPVQQQTIEITVTPLQWEIVEFNENIPTSLEAAEQPELGFSLEHAWDIRAAEDYVSLGVRVHVMSGTQQKADEIALLEFKGHFRIGGLKRFEQDGGLNLPAQPMMMIAGMTMDTARGVLLGLGRGTLLERVAVPPLPPNVFFPQQQPPAGQMPMGQHIN